MKRFKLLQNVLLLLFVSLIECACQQQIHPIETISSFREVNFSDIESGTLVIFDVDETLVQPVDSYLMNEYSQRAADFKKQLFQSHPEVKDWDVLASIMLQQAHRPLIEPIIVQKIQELQKRGITVIACTGMNVGPYGNLSSLEEWRYQHLKSLGFQGSYGNLIFKFNVSSNITIFLGCIPI